MLSTTKSHTKTISMQCAKPMASNTDAVLARKEADPVNAPRFDGLAKINGGVPVGPIV